MNLDKHKTCKHLNIERIKDEKGWYRCADCWGLFQLTEEEIKKNYLENKEEFA